MVEADGRKYDAGDLNSPTENGVPNTEVQDIESDLQMGYWFDLRHDSNDWC